MTNPFKAAAGKFRSKIKKPGFLTKNIFLLSLISFFTDIASEMLFPVMPLYLKEIGYSFLAIGILEGVAELIAGAFKLYSGNISDRIKNRTFFIRLGYGISAFAKPAIGLFTSFWAVFGLRFADRVGKGLRVSPRDALLADESSPENRGKVFGFHRTMDTLGATIGPVISLGFLLVIADYRKLFVFAFIPGLCAIFLTFLIREKRKFARPELPDSAINITDFPVTDTPAIDSAAISLAATENSIAAAAAITPTDAQPKKRSFDFFGFKKILQLSSPQYKKMIWGFFGFAIINSSNVFLLLRARELGMPGTYILAAYVLYNLVYAAASYPAGALADKIGYRNVYIVGLFVFAAVYGAFGIQNIGTVMLFVLFAVYGLFSAIEDSVSKAWLSLNIPQGHTATGLGLYMFLTSVGFFIASIATGFSWEFLGGPMTFSILSLLSLAAIFYFALLPNIKPEQKIKREIGQRYGK